MDFIVANWYLIAVAIISGGLLMWPVLNTASKGDLTTTRAVQLMNSQKAWVLDLREANEFAAGHIAGAKNLPANEMEAKMAAMAKNKALPVIIVCHTGARASRAVATAKKVGFENAQALAGGFKAWQEANLPVNKLKTV